MYLSDETIEAALLSGSHEIELRQELGDATYEELRGLGAEISAGSPVPAVPAGVSPQEVFGFGKPRKAIYILPGIMGSKLSVRSDLRDNLIWFDPASIALGQVEKLKYRPGKDNVFASGVFWAAYGWLRLKLSVAGYKTRFLPFDWRYPTIELGDALYRQILADGDSDVTLIAHSMGGLVARQVAKLDASAKKISRIITLGTPNNGSYSPVQVFRNVHSMVAKLDRLDPLHSAEDIIQDVLRDYPGLVEMMPDPKLRPNENYFDHASWPNSGTRPVQKVLDAALEAHNDLPLPDDRFYQIIGIGEKTVVSAEKTGNELQFRYSLDGDGTVPRDLAEMDGLPKTFVEESHGGLVKNRSVLSTLERLLEGKPPRTLAERDRYVSNVLFETVAEEVMSEEKLRARPMPQVDETARVQDFAEEFLGAPSRPAPPAGRVLSAAAVPEIRMIGGYPANLILQATENWEKAAPLRAKGRAAVAAGEAFQAESDVRRPIYAKRKVSQLIQIAAETEGAVTMPASLERVVAMAERNPAEAIDALLNERVLNEAEEFLSVLFVKRAAIVNKSVGRIVARGTRQGFGTGFLVAPGVLITNHHVLGTASDARNAAVQFDYELNARYRQLSSETFEFRPQDLFFSDRSLDFALVAVAETGLDQGHSLNDYGYLPLDEKVGKIRAEAPVNIIQHPQAGLKQVVFRSSKIFPLPSELDPGNSYSGKSIDTAAHYSGDTKPGSSGSPVFNDTWEVVALHHSAVAEMDAQRRIRMKDGSFKLPADIVDGDDIKWVANEGIRVSRIMKHLRGLKKDGVFQGKGLELVQRVFVVGDKATSNGAFNRPMPRRIFSVIEDPDASGVQEEAVPEVEPDRETRYSQGDKTPATGFSAVRTPGGVSITVPLTVQLSLGQAGLPTLSAPTEGSPPPPVFLGGQGLVSPAAGGEFAEERLYTVADLADRTGYDPDFLGVTVPFPGLRETAPGHPAQRLDNGKTQLDYDHYSVVMNADRRMAYVSAGNHDPAAPFKPARGKEPWSFDPRLSENEQAGNDLYKNNDLDRGHLLRRVDGSWGFSEQAAVRADHDTYFWTNITPQHKAFNQSKQKGVWGELENSVMRQATATQTRFSVFNGPIFGKNDRSHRGIKIPAGFWKLVAFATDCTLHALAFRLGQEELLVDIPLERILPEEFGVFQIPVSELADLVHMDFGPLEAADTLLKRQTSLESLAPGHRQIEIRQPGNIVV